jgi:serine/threonine protein kinase
MQTLQIHFLKGISFLHKHNVTHLDLKPGNILVDIIPLLYVTLIDFGLLKFVENEDTKVEGYYGTLSWTAPEVETADGPRQKLR